MSDEAKDPRRLRGRGIEAYAALAQSCVGLDVAELVERDDDGPYFDPRSPRFLAAVLGRGKTDSGTPVVGEED